MKNPKVYMLIGVPGAGKTTFLKKNAPHGSIAIVSTQSIIKDVMKKESCDYAAAYDKAKETIAETISRRISLLTERNKSIIIDQSNHTYGNRLKKFRLIPDHYERIGIVFNAPYNILRGGFLQLKTKEGMAMSEAEWKSTFYDKFQPPVPVERFSRILNGLELENAPWDEKAFSEEMAVKNRLSRAK